MWESLQSTLSDRFIEFMGLALTVLSGWAINQLRVWLKAKTTIALTDAQEKRLRELAEEAIDATEEWAHRQHRHGVPVVEGEKLDTAKKHLMSRISVVGGEAEGAIHAALGKRRTLPPPGK
jgi:glycosyltransferase A (GT-A) superfamily protein (DUF2064 family)